MMNASEMKKKTKESRPLALEGQFHEHMAGISSLMQNALNEGVSRVVEYELDLKYRSDPFWDVTKMILDALREKGYEVDTRDNFSFRRNTSTTRFWLRISWGD